MLNLILLASAYFSTGWLGLQIPYAGTHITLVWLPTGIAVAALLRWGRAVWPGIFIGAFLVNLSIGSSLWLAAGIAIGNTIAPFLTAELLRKFGFHTEFDRRKDIGSFILSASLGMSASATCGVLNLNFAGALPIEAMGSAWLSWWMGDTVGVLLAAPLLLTINKNTLKKLTQGRNELLAWILIAIPIAWITFLVNYQHIGHPIPITILTLPLFVWAALRFGIAGSSLAGLVFAILAAWGTATERGIFFLPDTQSSLFLLWAFMATTALTGLLIATLQAENIQVENSLRQNEKKLYEITEMRQAILDSTNFSIISTNVEGVIKTFNRGAEHMLGYSAEELVGIQTPAILHDLGEVVARAKTLSEELNATIEPGFDVFVAKARMLHVPDEQSWTYYRKDGTHLPVLLSVTAIRDDMDQVTDYLGVAVDITERVQNELRQTELTNELKISEERLRQLNVSLEQRVIERSEKLESTLKILHQSKEELARSETKAMLSTLIASVSHELNTPIGNNMLAATTMSAILRQMHHAISEGSVKRSELITMISELESCATLVERNAARAEQLLTSFRHVAADQASEQRRKFDLAAVTKEIIATLAPSLKKYSHKIELNIANGIIMDSLPGPLGQVIINLINNAYIHAFETRENGVITIDGIMSNDTLTLIIADNGIGIPEENLQQLFQAFFSTKIGKGGTGLGMAIVRNLVTKTLKGELTVQSTVGIGTRFDITLPLVLPANNNES